MKARSDNTTNNQTNINNDGFIIPFWEKIFGYLSKLSMFSLIKLSKLFKVDSVFIEKWVLFNLIFAIISSIITYLMDFGILSLVFMIYGMIRVFEVITYQINVLLFDPYRAKIKGIKYSIKSPTRMVLLLLHNYVELIFWFATVYISLSSMSGVNLGFNWSDYIRISALCFTSNDLSFIGYPGITRTIVTFAYVEMVGGMVMTIISLARFIGLLPSVESDDIV